MDDIKKLQSAINTIARQRDDAMNAIVNLQVVIDDLSEQIRSLKEKPNEDAAPAKEQD